MVSFPIVRAFLALAMLGIVRAQTDAELMSDKWSLADPVTSFAQETNTFTMTFPVDDSITTINTDAQMYESGCLEGNQELNAVDGVISMSTEVAATGSATMTFDLDMALLSKNPDVLAQTVDESATMKICARFMLITDDLSTEVNYIETVITMIIDLTAGFVVDEFNVANKERITDANEKTYGVSAYLCDVNTGLEAPADIRFNQGSLIGVCVQPDQAAIDDGLFLQSIDFFNWIRGTIEQPAISGGSEAGNGLTIFSCTPGSDFCSFESVLYADFYTPPTRPPTEAPVGVEAGGFGGAISTTGTFVPSTIGYYECELSLPTMDTTSLVHGLCYYDFDSFSAYYYQQGSSTNIDLSYNSSGSSFFNQNTQLFGDKDYTPDIVYDGSGSPNTTLCEGGTYLQAPNFETMPALNHYIKIESSLYNGEPQTDTTRIYVMVIDEEVAEEERRDGGADFNQTLVESALVSTVSTFDYVSSSSNDTGTMRVYEIEMWKTCYPVFYRERELHEEKESSAERNLQTGLTAEVSGVGQATLAFPGRRNLGEGETEDSTRNLQESPDPFDIGLSIQVDTEAESRRPLRTAGGMGFALAVGIKSLGAWAVVTAVFAFNFV